MKYIVRILYDNIKKYFWSIPKFQHGIRAKFQFKLGIDFEEKLEQVLVKSRHDKNYEVETIAALAHQKSKNKYFEEVI